MDPNIFIPSHHLGTIVVDVGGVVGDTLHQFTRLGANKYDLEERSGNDVVPHYDLREWWSDEDTFEQVLTDFKKLQNPYKSMPVLKHGSIDQLLRVSSQADLVFYSQAPPTRGHAVKDQLKAFLQRRGVARPRIETSDPNMPGARTLGHICAVYQAAGVIDDNPSRFPSVEQYSPDTLPMLLYQEHNKNEEYVHVDSVDEFLHVVDAA